MQISTLFHNHRFDMDGILERLLDAQKLPRTRPFILLTWAQTTDAMLSHVPGTRTQISGSQSNALTHSLRALHDIILVGVGTVLADDPRLSTRLENSTRNRVHALSRKYDRSLKHDDACPIAAVLDSGLRTPTTSKFLTQPHCKYVWRRPFVFTKVGMGENLRAPELSRFARVVEVDAIPTTKGTILNLTDVVDRLQLEGATSVMVEGGPTVLSSFLEAGLCDLLIITIAPIIFSQGLPLTDVSRDNGPFLMRMKNPQWLQLGNDVVLVAEP